MCGASLLFLCVSTNQVKQCTPTAVIGPALHALISSPNRLLSLFTTSIYTTLSDFLAGVLAKRSFSPSKHEATMSLPDASFLKVCAIADELVADELVADRLGYWHAVGTNASMARCPLLQV